MSLPEQVILERDAMMFELRKRGLTYEQIGKAMKVSTKTAHNGVRRMTERILKRMTTDYAGQAVLDLERLDSMLSSVWDLTKKRQVETPDGETIDLPPSMEAIDRVLKIMDRRAKLLGLDAAKAIEVSVNQQVSISQTSEQSTTEVDKRRETLELLKVMKSAGVLDENVLEHMLTSLGETEEILEIEDASVLELEPVATEAPPWDGDDGVEEWQR